MAYLPYSVGFCGFAPPHLARFRALLDGLRLPVRLVAFDPARSESTVEKMTLVLLTKSYSKPLINTIRRTAPAAPIVVIDDDSSQRAAIDAIRAGADDYLCDRRCDAEIIERLAGYFCSVPRECSDTPIPQSSQHGWVGGSAAAQRIWSTTVKVAPSKSTILIEGDTGVGKDVIALAIHRLSNRAQKPLVTMNCAAIPEALVEGELMGYRKGAFTGAVRAYEGKFRLAHGGTLFLDEVGELSLPAQAKILRAIESRQICALGSDQTVDIDVRIVAATNQNLEQAVKEGRFRADLYYRLAVVRLNLPSLADRRRDIAAIARHLLSTIAADNGMACPEIGADMLSVLEQHDWPGNVRELRNVLEHACVTAENPALLMARDLPLLLQPGQRAPLPEQSPPPPGSEREVLIAALIRHSGRKAEAARSLKCSRMTLYRRLERAGIDAEAIAAAGVSAM